MNESSLQPQRHLLDGATRVFLAEALIFPSGLIIVIFLTRKLGPESYGHFTLAAAIITWLALLMIAALFILMISMASAILTAAGKPLWTFALTGPMLPLALVGHLALIPRLGTLSASLTNSIFAILEDIAAVYAV